MNILSDDSSVYASAQGITRNQHNKRAGSQTRTGSLYIDKFKDSTTGYLPEALLLSLHYHQYHTRL